ncbi:LTA synthase family protein [Flavobacteriaceae bacterium]|nr:LTA synthase family protein [Flavobacteriaceae bacterium]
MFFLFLSISFIVTHTLNSFSSFDRSSFLEKINFEYKTSNLEIRKSNDPVILILMDGLSSSEEIFKHTNDSIDLKLDFYLENQGYEIISNAKTESLRTTISVPSLFNFNLHNSIDRDSIENIDKGLQTIDGLQDIFHENLLVDSLLTRSIKPYSFGIGEFTRGINNDNFCYLWGDSCDNSTLEFMMKKTIIKTIIHGLDRDTEKIGLFRKNSLEQLENLVPVQKSFYYFHLFFPHDPYSYYEEYPNVKLNYFTISEEDYLSEHIKYKRWFVDKFINLIENADFKNSRIIITGDHGFRHNKLIAPELTNIYLKGYSLINANDNITVQQIGNIILESFF